MTNLSDNIFESIPQRLPSIGRRIAIIGAGFAGIVSGWSLYQLGFDVDIFERRKEGELNGFMVVLQPNGLYALEKLGILSSIKDLLIHNLPNESMSFMDEYGNIIREMTTSHELGIKYNKYYSCVPVVRPELLQLFIRFISKNTQIHFHYQHKLINIENNEIKSFDKPLLLKFKKLSSSEEKIVEYNYDLVVGCDGIHSKVRSLMYPNIIDKESSKNTEHNVYQDVIRKPNYSVIVGVDLDIEKKEENRQKFVDYEWFEDQFLIKKRFANILSKYIHVTCVYSKSCKKLGIWFSFNRELFEKKLIEDKKIIPSWCISNEIRNLDKKIIQEYVVELVNKYVKISFIQDVSSKLNWETESFLWDLREIDVNTMDHQKYYQNRIILMGDSSHAMSPWQGQGLNQIFEDSLCLQEQLKLWIQEKNGELNHLETYFENYEKKRKPVLKLLKIADTKFNLSTTPIYYYRMYFEFLFFPTCLFRQVHNQAVSEFCKQTNVKPFDESFFPFLAKIGIQLTAIACLIGFAVRH
jgi:2-polyprenyl-6-methoxyphenol hydroxylase-like FAD-dependent oxidoreductase